MNKPGFFDVVTGALLHDIGKFAQRMKDTSYPLGNEQDLCPFNSRKGYFSHRHVLYTESFINRVSTFFPSEADPSYISILAAKHHKPDSPYQQIITEADWLSSGQDRSKKEETDCEDKKYFEQPLKSVFSKVSFEDRAVNAGVYYHGLRGFTPENVFPEKTNLTLSTEGYRAHWVSFEKEFRELGGLSWENFFYALDSMLEQYTWCIPSSTMDEPDISLYDHLVTTAAFAAVLYKYHEDIKELENETAIKSRAAKKFLFVSGDLSGIQSYIFNLINTRYNAKILRARSFELDAFSQSAAKRILKKLGLPHLCRIMNAGGRFILLLPNTRKVKETLYELRLEIESFCLSRYFGELSLNISEGVEASGEELGKKNAADLFLRISADVAEAKQKKLQAVLGKSGHVLSLEYEKIRGNENVCEICARRAVVKDNLCKVCSELVLFGSVIPKAKYLAFAKNDKKTEQCQGLSLLKGDTVYAFREKQEKLFSFSVNRYSPGFGRIDIPYFLPSENGEVITFEELGEKSEGVKKIAMFKADVDNLGGIFSLGFKKRISISRYASLSRMLNYFFSGWVNHSIETGFSNIYTVFSGGDDLCVIGPWTEIIDFSMELNDEFKKFSAENESITISGGIVLAGSSLPVRNIAANAEEELEKAKEKKKNRITVFDTTVLWKDFKRLKKFGEALFRKADEGKISEGLLYRLLDYGERNGKFIKGDVSARNGLWRAHFRYDVFRNVDKENKGGSEVRDWLLEEVEKNIDNIRLSASYALYRLRNNHKKGEGNED